MLAFQMRIEYFTLFFLILSFNSLSQKKTFKEYNQKIGGIDLNLKIDEISPLNILKLTNKYFSAPFLSISGNEKICLEISNRWKNNF